MRRVAPTTRSIAWCCLVVHGLVASGLPLPLALPGVDAGRGDPVAAARLAGKDRSTPFPCMDKPCGCATAEQCFTSCCCNTPGETLVWARVHGVAPAVLAALERRAQATAEPAATCCSAAGASCCSAAEEPTAEASCCASLEPPAAPAADPLPSPPGERRVVPKQVVFRAMLACGGIVAAWCACGTALPPPLPCVIPSPSPTSTVDLIDEVPAHCLSAPDAPPPRAA